MKKISILLMSVLFALAVSCSNKSTGPGNNDGNSTQNGIPLSQRAGTYSGTMSIGALEIVLSDQAQVTSIKLNGTESLEGKTITITEGAGYTGTTIAPFDATIYMTNPQNQSKIPMDAKVKIEFTSADDASQGATAYVQVPAGTDFNQDSATKVPLKYTK